MGLAARRPASVRMGRSATPAAADVAACTAGSDPPVGKVQYYLTLTHRGNSDSMTPSMRTAGDILPPWSQDRGGILADVVKPEQITSISADSVTICVGQNCRRCTSHVAVVFLLIKCEHFVSWAGLKSSLCAFPQVDLHATLMGAAGGDSQPDNSLEQPHFTGKQKLQWMDTFFFDWSDLSKWKLPVGSCSGREIDGNRLSQELQFQRSVRAGLCAKVSFEHGVSALNLIATRGTEFRQIMTRFPHPECSLIVGAFTALSAIV